MEISTVGTKKSRRPNRPKSLNLVQSRQSLTTVSQEVLQYTRIQSHNIGSYFYQLEFVMQTLLENFLQKFIYKVLSCVLFMLSPQ